MLYPTEAAQHAVSPESEQLPQCDGDVLRENRLPVESGANHGCIPAAGVLRNPPLVAWLASPVLVLIGKGSNALAGVEEHILARVAVIYVQEQNGTCESIG